MDSRRAIAALAALAQESRLRVFRLLVQRGPEGLPAGVISERIAVPPTTLSFHLTQLARAGLVRARRDGRSIVYAAEYGGMQSLVDFLSEKCCQGGTCGPAEPRPGRLIPRRQVKSGGRGD